MKPGSCNNAALAFRNVYTQSALILCGELIDRTGDDKALQFREASTSTLKKMREAIDEYLDLASVICMPATAKSNAPFLSPAY